MAFVESLSEFVAWIDAVLAQFKPSGFLGLNRPHLQGQVPETVAFISTLIREIQTRINGIVLSESSLNPFQDYDLACRNIVEFVKEICETEHPLVTTELQNLKSSAANRAFECSAVCPCKSSTKRTNPPERGYTRIKFDNGQIHDIEISL